MLPQITLLCTKSKNMKRINEMANFIFGNLQENKKKKRNFLYFLQHFFISSALTIETIDYKWIQTKLNVGRS